MKGWLGSLAVVALLGGSAAGVAAQGSTAPQKTVVIGCVQREGSNFVLKDERSNQNVKLQVTEKDFEFHIGHKVELGGTWAGGSDTFRVETIVYIAPSCK